MLSIDNTIHHINQSTYKLDTSGVVGLFAGDIAVDALVTIHLYAGRKWAGWYNYPGAVTVAKTFGQMADSRLWDSVFPGPNESPAVTFNLAGKPGPNYIGSYSGTKLRAFYPGYLIAKKCAESPSKPLPLFKEDGTKGRETGSPAAVTILSLPPRQHSRIKRSLAVAGVSGAKQKHQFIPINPKSKYNPPLALWSIAPSLFSILACILCFLAQDSLGASLILLGIVSSGFSSLALGTATLKIRVPVPSAASPPGDGLMFPENGNTIILKGEEADVNVVTKGEFELDYSTGLLPHPKHHTIGVSSLLLYVQSLVQLLLIPRCTFFGQIMFLLSFVASGAYHLYVASHEREKVQCELLSHELSERMEKWMLGTRTQMAVFVCLVLGDGRSHPLKSNPDATLIRIIPNETDVWKYWKKKVVKELERFWNWDPASPVSYAPIIQVEPLDEDKAEIEDYSRLTEEDTRLLDDLIGDAWSVFSGYSAWRNGMSRFWQEQFDDADENPKACLLPAGSVV